MIICLSPEAGFSGKLKTMYALNELKFGYVCDNQTDQGEKIRSHVAEILRKLASLRASKAVD